MNREHHTHETAGADDARELDPREAATLLEQTNTGPATVWAVVGVGLAVLMVARAASQIWLHG
jgi:hypothetical protein